MNRIVALDTSTWWGGVALLEGRDRETIPDTVAEAGLHVSDSHAAHLLRLLDALLSEAGWTRSTVDAFAATRGPGSFTGIRVGLGTLRGLGLASGRPCLGVGTLWAMAEAFGPTDSERVPLLDAGRGEVYGARYDAASVPPLELVPPWVGAPALALAAGGQDAVFFGTGARALHDAGSERAGFEGRLGRSPTGIAAAAGRLAWLRIARGAGDGDGLAPLYLRPPDAEVKADRS